MFWFPIGMFYQFLPTLSALFFYGNLLFNMNNVIFCPHAFLLVNSLQLFD